MYGLKLSANALLYCDFSCNHHHLKEWLLTGNAQTNWIIMRL